MAQLLSEQELHFLLYRVFQAETLAEYAAYADYDRAAYQDILSTARHIAEQYFLPHNAAADEQEPQFRDGRVTTLPAVKEAWRQFAEAGLLAARHQQQHGGLQMPALIHSACNAYFMAANPATAAYPFLTSAAANVIAAFGTEAQQDQWLEPMLTGQFAGTMALTEPDVGSSLGDLTTRATPTNSGHYLINGQKMYISGGDQDITDNIVHLVLARIAGAPAGTKGISLFIVPKYRLTEDGQPGAANDVTLAGLLHKMGYRGTTSTVLNFGEQSDCHGYLIGEPHQGLRYMFKMMNEARTGVGLGAAMIGYRGYQESLSYARDRPQGRTFGAAKDSRPVPIIEHTDVRRMLLQQKVWTEGSLALCLFAARLVDDAEAGEDQQAALLLDLLIPIVKSYPSWYGPQANDLAIQVLGGAGYIREYPVEQCYRDNRLNPIHEGTHGIQSLDLLGRKLWQQEQAGLQELQRRFNKTLAQAAMHPEIQPLVDSYQQHLPHLHQTIETLGQAMQKGDITAALGDSALFMDYLGQFVVGWLWLDLARHAAAELASEPGTEQTQFLRGKLQAARFFMQRELPKTRQQADILQRLDSTTRDMDPAWF